MQRASVGFIGVLLACVPYPHVCAPYVRILGGRSGWLGRDKASSLPIYEMPPCRSRDILEIKRDSLSVRRRPYPVYRPHAENRKFA
jgi:hypothetical protein